MRLGVIALACSACSTPTTPGWMSAQPDQISLAALTLPGTHDTMALYEPLAGTAKAQTMSLAEQYDAGIRYVDIRCVDVEDVFQIYHGIEFEQATFDDVLDTTFAFLDAHPTETIVMSVKQEADDNGATQSFEATFDDYVTKQASRWYTEDAVPTLGEVRGEIVLLRRFGAEQTPTTRRSRSTTRARRCGSRTRTPCRIRRRNGRRSPSCSARRARAIRRRSTSRTRAATR
jgi:1-phosphatidylinositol phosphodiesterase